MRELTKKNIFILIKNILIKNNRAKDNITYSTAINIDLGIDGDDAVEFLEYIREELYKINYIINFDDFEYNIYFGSEGIDSFNLISKIFTENSSKIMQLTIDILITYILNNANVAGYIHEEHGGNLFSGGMNGANEYDMDIYNNICGQNNSKKPEKCSYTCKQSLNNGILRTIGISARKP